MKTVILGATKGMGRALARMLVERGDDVFLLGRDPSELNKSANDLEIRGGRPVGAARCDLANPETFPAAFDAASRTLNGIECVIVTAAEFATQEELENSSHRLARLLEIDFKNTILLCEEARQRLGTGGVLCVFSSVAGDRPRKPVIFYGACKAGLSYYLEGLDFKYRSQGLTTICVKPGFVRTGMTAGLKPPPFSVDPDQVAKRVLRAIDKRSPQVYAPAIWRWVMTAICALPRSVMRRVKF